jgi:hypothetical protein
MAPDGRFFIAWQTNGEDGGGWSVVGREYPAGLATPGGEIAINQTTAGAQDSPGVAYLSNAGTTDGCVVAWQSEGQGGFDALASRLALCFDCD